MEILLFDFKKPAEPEQPWPLGSDAFGIRSWTQSLCQEVAGKCYETELKTQQCVLKRGVKTFPVKESCGELQRESCGKLQRGDVCDSSGSCGNLQRGVENQLDRTRLDHHNMQISDYRHVEKVLATKIASQLFHTRCEDQHIDQGIVYVGNVEIISLSWTSISREFGSILENQLRGAQDVVRKNVEIDRGTIIRDSQSIYDDIHCLALDEIYSVSSSSNQMGESISASLPRFGLVSGKDA